MSIRLTWNKIRQQHPDEWVILVDLDADEETDEVFGGVVLDHDASEKTLIARTKEAAAGKSAAILFTGEIGKGSFLF
ncbi:MAG: hypothetical protein HY814_15060 [Candidatus Riflebacteria bacterium]|nr:hypothetical protein [Candidatus Riflebacteria bacterium]